MVRFKGIKAVSYTHLDFELGLHEGIRAAESVLITVSGRSGLTVGAQKAYKLALKHGKSRMIRCV